MKRNGRLTITVIALAMVVATLFVVLSKRQPTYQGRTVNSWLEQVFDTKGNQRQAIDALRELGAKAVPIEIDALARTDSPLDKWYQSVYPKLPLSLTNQNRDIRSSAAYALLRYGPAAKGAAPGLVNALNDSDAQVRKAARVALEKIDPEAEAKGGGAHGQDH